MCRSSRKCVVHQRRIDFFIFLSHNGIKSREMNPREREVTRDGRNKYRRDGDRLVGVVMEISQWGSVIESGRLRRYVFIRKKAITFRG